ncbi:MAG: hypothetical protein LIO72_03450 [Ruminococcus sp.]|nr:hypothetical protein [Ruminococcus sp.]
MKTLRPLSSPSTTFLSRRSYKPSGKKAKATKTKLNRITAVFVACLILLTTLFTGCSNVKDEPEVTEEVTEDATADPEDVISISGVEHDGSFYGSFLTMVLSYDSADSYPKAYIMHSYSEIEEYYYATERIYSFGARFTITMASFTDDFFEDNDVMIVVISEPSTYVSHSVEDMELLSDGAFNISITRHIPENAPLSDGTIYHLVFTAPKGGFDDVDVDKVSVDITELIDDDNVGAFGSERFIYNYPEFWPFTFKTPALVDDVEPTVDSLETYEEMLGFYETHKGEFDLDTMFVKYFGAVFDEEMFEEYVLLVMVLPFDKTLSKPEVTDVFIYNYQIFVTIDNLTYDFSEDNVQWYLLAVAVDRSSLENVDLMAINIAPD